MTPEEHFATFVQPAFRAYTAAEEALTSAVRAGGNVSLAESVAMCAAMSAATPAWHLADWMWESFKSTNSQRLLGATSLAVYRRNVEAQSCQMLRTGQPTGDFDILGAVVDAFKHFQLSNPARQVRSARATIATGTGFGQLGFGEGKFGGTTQVVVTLIGGNQRAFSTIIQNVVDMWRREFGLPLLPFGE